MTDPAFGEGPLARFLWPLLASLAGGIASVGLRPFEGLSPGKIFMAVFVGFSFSYFVGPWAIRLMFSSGEAIDIKVLGGVYWTMATGSNYLIALFIRKIGAVMGDDGKGDPK